jgi:hypothetical protein
VTNDEGRKLMGFCERHVLEMISSKFGEDYKCELGRNIIDYMLVWERLLTESDKV